MKKLSLLLAVVMALTCASALAEFNAEGLPITNETVTFTFLIDDSYTTEDHAVIYDMLEEQTNVHVELDLYPYQTALEKLSIYLSTGDYPEVIGGWLLGTQDFLDLGNGEGTFLALDELIEKYCPNISAVLEIPGVRDSMTMPDGHIYSIPYVVSEPKCTFKPYINRQWLENVGMEMPTTPEELKQVLIAFRDQDANGNGDPNDEIPFSGDPINLNLGMCAGWFGVDAAGNSDYPYYELKDGKLHFAANTDEFRQFLEYFADLYSEKLIDPEIFTQDSETWKGKGNQNLYGVCIGYGPGDWYDNFEEGEEGYDKWSDVHNEFFCLPVLKGCDTPIFHRNSYGVTLFRTQVAITDKCDEEKAAIILRWFDNLYTEENSIQSQSGLLGKSIEKIGDSLYREFDKTNWSEEEKTANDWGHIFTQSAPRWYHDAKVIAYDKTEVTKGENDWYDEQYEPYLNDTFAKVWPTNEDDIERSSVLTTDIKTYVKTMIAQFVSGQVELNDKSWADYCQKLLDMGLEELTEINCRIIGIEKY